MPRSDTNPPIAAEPKQSPGQKRRDVVVFKPPRLPKSPFVYRKMLEPAPSQLQNGAYALLVSRQGEPLARGFLNRRSEIGFRVVAGPDGPEGVEDLLSRRIQDAWRLRTELLKLDATTNAYRVVNAEGDGLSGLTLDRYGKTCVAGVYSIAYIANAEALERVIKRLPGIERVHFRADERSQSLEEFRLPKPEPGLEETVREGAIEYRVDLSSGHKTGLFLDQRENRALFGGLAKGRNVLDLCTNAGGFALVAAHARATSVTAIDLDEVALERARGNARKNKLTIDFQHADLFPFLREKTASGTRFEAVVLDPSKLAKHRGEAREALMTYREMNVLAMKAVAEGGVLFTFSCSGSVSESEFLEMLQRAADEAGRRVRVLEIRGAGPDHPIAMDFPEGRYLKGVLLHLS